MKTDVVCKRYVILADPAFFRSVLMDGLQLLMNHNNADVRISRANDG